MLAGQMPDTDGFGEVVHLQEAALPNTSIFAFGQTVYVHVVPVECLFLAVTYLQGQIVYQHTIVLPFTETPLPTWPSGVYRVVLQNSEKRYSKLVYLIP